MNPCLNIFRYGVSFGSPFSKGLGIGYVQELVSRLTETPIETHNTSTNGTLHNPVTFPFGHSLYVDATHEVVVLYGMFQLWSQNAGNQE